LVNWEFDVISVSLEAPAAQIRHFLREDLPNFARFPKPNSQAKTQYLPKSTPGVLGDI
jgi:hypothetical protein